MPSIGNATLSGPAWAINWTPTVTGVASISAIATDNNGNAVAAPAVGVTVTDATSPAITLSLSPGLIVGGIATLPSGATRNAVANVTPASGRAIVRVEFFVDGTKMGEDTSAPYTFRYVAPDLAGRRSCPTPTCAGAGHRPCRRRAGHHAVAPRGLTDRAAADGQPAHPGEQRLGGAQCARQPRRDGRGQRWHDRLGAILCERQPGVGEQRQRDHVGALHRHLHADRGRQLHHRRHRHG